MLITPIDIESLFKRHVNRQTFLDLATLVGQDRFLQMYLPFTEQVVSRLSEIPLSRDAFAGPGGAATAAINAGVLAVKLCDKTIFEPGATAARRMAGDVQYRWLAYCASLATVYLMAVDAVRVELEGGEIYSFASATPLTEVDHPFTVKWSATTKQPVQVSYLLLTELFFAGQFDDLSPPVLGELGASINPTLQSLPNEPPLAKVVRQAIERVIEDDKARSRQVIHASVDSVEAVEAKVEHLEDAGQASGARAAEHVQANVVAGEAKPLKSVEEPSKPSPQALKAAEWIRGLAAMSSLHAEVQVKEDGNIKIGRKALSFGAAATDNYQMLYEAGLVVQKVEGGVVCTARVREAFETAKGDMK
ncbi:MAG: TraI domain-containing protein [Hydrogenophaga sp.]|nr:TraI domain-containing protein [Hydrogenophaga sp.]